MRLYENRISEEDLDMKKKKKTLFCAWNFEAEFNAWCVQQIHIVQLRTFCLHWTHYTDVLLQYTFLLCDWMQKSSESLNILNESMAMLSRHAIESAANLSAQQFIDLHRKNWKFWWGESTAFRFKHFFFYNNGDAKHATFTLFIWKMGSCHVTNTNTWEIQMSKITHWNWPFAVLWMVTRYHCIRFSSWAN